MNIQIIILLLLSIFTTINSNCQTGYSYYVSHVVGYTVDTSTCNTCSSYRLKGAGKDTTSNKDLKLICDLEGTNECQKSNLVVQYDSTVCNLTVNVQTFGTMGFALDNINKKYPLNDNVTICAQGKSCYLPTSGSTKRFIIGFFTTFILILMATLGTI